MKELHLEKILKSTNEIQEIHNIIQSLIHNQKFIRSAKQLVNG